MICDLRLAQNETGIDVIRRIRAHFEEDVPAILISGDTAPQRMAEVRAAGLSMVHKPLAPAKLRTLIGQTLSTERATTSRAA
jgi:two-component system, sensor histidine kinase